MCNSGASSRKKRAGSPAPTTSYCMYSPKINAKAAATTINVIASLTKPARRCQVVSVCCCCLSSIIFRSLVAMFLLCSQTAEIVNSKSACVAISQQDVSAHAPPTKRAGFGLQLLQHTEPPLGWVLNRRICRFQTAQDRRALWAVPLC